jgi:DNA-binding MarR family transcriptional regulator
MSHDLVSELNAAVGALSSQLRLRFLEASGRSQGFVALATLRHLYRHGPRTVTSLAVSDRVTTQAVSARLKPLEEAGLVLRERDPDDSRRTVVTPTPAGIAIVREAEEGAQDALRSALARLPDEERTVLEQAAPILAALAADLTGGKT